MFVLSGLSACSSPGCGSTDEANPPPPSEAGAEALGVPKWKKPGPPPFSLFVHRSGCSADAFFLDVREDSPAVDDGFPDRIEARLTRLGRAQGCAWLGSLPEESRALGCRWDPARKSWTSERARALTVVVEPVFEERYHPSGACLLHDGHLRFFRIRIKVAGRPLVVPDEAVCSVEKLIASSADDVAHVEGRVPEQLALCGDTARRVQASRVRFDVGRACPLRPLEEGVALDPPRLPSAELATWHLKQLGADPIPPHANVASHVRPTTWLVDTGVSAEVAVALGIESGAAPGLRLDPHGSALAALIRRISPHEPAGWGGTIRTRLVSSPVFDERYRGAALDLARELEAIAADAFEAVETPHIVNLSLGWPPHLTRSQTPRPVCGGIERCAFQEGPAGGAVRFALALLRFGAPRATVLAAPGHRPAGWTAAGAADEDGRLVESLGQGVCSSTAAAAAAAARGRQASLMYYPAQWGAPEDDEVRVNPFTRQAAAGAHLVTPVGAIDGTLRRVLTTRPPAGLALEAPGQHVYLSEVSGGAKAVRRPEAAICTKAADARSQNRALLAVPSAWSGTSVSTALMSAVVAEAHLAWAETHPTSRSHTAAETLAFVYVTGLPTQTAPWSRRPSLCRIRAAAGAGGSCGRNLTRCLQGVGDLDAWALHVRGDRSCRRVSRSCASAWARCEGDGTPSRWPADYPEAGAYCRAVSWKAQPIRYLDCGKACVEVAAAGDLAPTRLTDFCPDCALRMDLDGAPSATVLLELNPDLPADVVLARPTLLLVGKGAEEAAYRLLEPTGEAVRLSLPGEHLSARVDLGGLRLRPSAAMLVVTVEARGFSPALTMASPLRVE